MTVETTEQVETPAENAQEKDDSTRGDAAHEPTIELDRIVAPIEAMLVSTDRPLKAIALVDAISAHLDVQIKTDDVVSAIELLNEQYAESGRAFTIESISGGYRMMTRPEHAPVIAAMHRSRASTRLSKPALETLAIIAYRQPITRAELESIRGVACGEVVRSLMERKLVKITGRAEELGRPMLYGTTRQFLDTFGLSSVKDLPKPEEFADQMVQQGI